MGGGGVGYSDPHTTLIVALVLWSLNLLSPGWIPYLFEYVRMQAIDLHICTRFFQEENGGNIRTTGMCLRKCAFLATSVFQRKRWWFYQLVDSKTGRLDLFCFFSPLVFWNFFILLWYYHEIYYTCLQEAFNQSQQELNKNLGSLLTNHMVWN